VNKKPRRPGKRVGGGRARSSSFLVPERPIASDRSGGGYPKKPPPPPPPPGGGEKKKNVFFILGGGEALSPRKARCWGPLKQRRAQHFPSKPAMIALIPPSNGKNGGQWVFSKWEHDGKPEGFEATHRSAPSAPPRHHRFIPHMVTQLFRRPLSGSIKRALRRPRLPRPRPKRFVLSRPEERGNHEPTPKTSSRYRHARTVMQLLRLPDER